MQNTNNLYKCVLHFSPRKKSSYSSLIPSSDSEESEDFIEPERKQLFKDYPRNSLTSVMSLNILNSDAQSKSVTDGMLESWLFMFLSFLQ